MTLLFFDGFDNANTLAKPEWGPGSDQVFTNATGRNLDTNGAGSFAGSTITVRTKTMVLPSSAATCFCGFGASLNSAWISQGNTTRDQFVVAFMVGSVVQCFVMVNTSGFIEIRRGSTGAGTLLATSSAHAPIAADTWNHWQVKYIAHGSTGVCEVRLNGATLLNVTGANTAATPGPVSALRISSYQTGAMILDDYWVCDDVDATVAQGRPNNTFLGDLKVVTLVPTAAGDATFWTPSTGANYAALDENPPSTTDYVSALGSGAGVRDLYNCTDLPAAATEVFAMRGALLASKSDIGQAAVRNVIKQDGVVEVAAGLQFTPPFGGYSAWWDPELLTLRVSDDTPLAVADINGMQIGLEVA